MFNVFKKKQKSPKKLIKYSNSRELEYLLENIYTYNKKNSDNLIHPFILDKIENSYEDILVIRSKGYDIIRITDHVFNYGLGPRLWIADIGDDIIQILEEKILEADKKIKEDYDNKRQQAREEILKENLKHCKDD